MGKVMKENKKIVNWSEYNASLVKRGRFSLWIDDIAINSWYHQEKRIGSGKRKIYSDNTVRLMAIISEIYSLPYRQTEGLFREILDAMGHHELGVPQYTILSKRSKDAEFDSTISKIKKLKATGEHINIVMDATGLKVYGEYEWKVRTHGKGKKRKWLKLHAAIDRDTRQVISYSLTNNDVHDGEEFVKLLNTAKSHGYKIEKCYADGAYSWHCIFDRLQKDAIIPRIPLPKNSVISGENREDAIPVLRPRDKALLEIHDAGGLSKWKKSTDYHFRNLIENLFSRAKIIFGERLKPRSDEARSMRVNLRLNILNTFAAMGLPKYN